MFVNSAKDNCSTLHKYKKVKREDRNIQLYTINTLSENSRLY
jgi:hypothetical protein